MWNSLGKVSSIAGLLGLSMMQLFSNDLIRWLSFAAFIAFLVFLACRVRQQHKVIFPSDSQPRARLSLQARMGSALLTEPAEKELC